MRVLGERVGVSTLVTLPAPQTPKDMNVSEGNQRKVYVVQRPPRLDHFDVEALKGLGDVDYLAPNAPSIHDPERMNMDFRRMLHAINNAGPDDVFVAVGGSPISNWLFGAALFASGVKSLNVGMYSRDMDKEGARLDKGRYRVVNMVTEFPDDE